MTIQFNADKNLTIRQGFETALAELLKDELSRFSENITRIEVHFSDENGPKTGQDDKKCLLEARLQGLQPVVVSAMDGTYELAIYAAIVKLKAVLEKTLGKLNYN